MGAPGRRAADFARRSRRWRWRCLRSTGATGVRGDRTLHGPAWGWGRGGWDVRTLRPWGICLFVASPQHVHPRKQGISGFGGDVPQMRNVPKVSQLRRNGNSLALPTARLVTTLSSKGGRRLEPGFLRLVRASGRAALVEAPGWRPPPEPRERGGSAAWQPRASGAMPRRRAPVLWPCSSAGASVRGPQRRSRTSAANIAAPLRHIMRAPIAGGALRCSRSWRLGSAEPAHLVALEREVWRIVEPSFARRVECARSVPPCPVPPGLVVIGARHNERYGVVSSIRFVLRLAGKSVQVHHEVRHGRTHRPREQAGR